MLIFAGFFVGLIIGLTGVGGGALMTPLLILFFGFSPATTIGTDLWFSGLTKLSAGKIYQLNSLIDWKVVLTLWSGSLPSSLIVLLLMNLGLLKMSANFLMNIVGLVLILSVFGIMFRENLHKVGLNLRVNRKVFFKKWQKILTIFAGILLGAMVTVTSIGAGAIGAIMLAYLYPLRLTPSKLVATDVIHAIPLALFAGAGHLILGNVDYVLLAWLLAGSIPGVILGAKLVNILPQKILRFLIALVLFISGMKLLMK